MIRVLIMSDSHGQLDNVRKVIQKEEKPDLVIHLGDIAGQDELLREICDCPVKIVRGNCDFYSQNPLTDIISVGKYKIFATHGHQYGVNWGLDRISYAAEENGCDIAMYGHTHVPDISYFGKVTIVNPGSISRPRQLNRKPTYATLTIDNNEKYDIVTKYV